ncbi:MAG TPA: FAD-binding oxidoreductase [Nitrososphaera sp.]
MPFDESLLRIAKGELLTDDWSRTSYSVDASHYEVMPSAILCPADEYDVQLACKYSHDKKISVTARGAGTGLLGQSLSDGVILDFTKNMNRVIEVGENHVVVQPGIVKAVLDLELRKSGKFLPPDPASSNYCTVGGMIADNSSGVHCLGYGNTIDFLDEVKTVYADGTFGHSAKGNCDQKMLQLRELLLSNLSSVENGFPRVSKNSCGYRLDAVVEGGDFNPQRVFAASEGTLGIVTQAQFRILDIPESRSLLVLGFQDLLAALRIVPAILEFSPVALEMMDHTVFAHGSPESSGLGCLLFVEFAGEKTEPERQMELCRRRTTGTCTALEHASDEQSIARIWGARKGALNNIMKLTVGSRKPIGLIEDTVVRPHELVDHATDLLDTYRDHKMKYVMYGHVGDGNMHTRPLIDISSEEETGLVETIARRIFSRVVANGGTITGEHGDGIARVPFIELMYGKKITEIFASVKKLFDPMFSLNPGKKVPMPVA